MVHPYGNSRVVSGLMDHNSLAGILLEVFRRLSILEVLITMPISSRYKHKLLPYPRYINEAHSASTIYDISATIDNYKFKTVIHTRVVYYLWCHYTRKDYGLTGVIFEVQKFA